MFEPSGSERDDDCAAPQAPARESGEGARRLAAATHLLPGPEAIGLLSDIDAEALVEEDRVTLLQLWEKQARWVAARQSAAVVAVAGRRPADRDDFAREEVRVALLDSGGSPRADVDLARALAGPLAAAQAALTRGELSYPHARILAQETAVLDPATARQVADAMVPVGAGCTPGQFRRHVRRAVIETDPLGAELAAEQAARLRQVDRRPLADAQAMLTVTGPALDVQTIWTALDAQAARTRATGAQSVDPRTLDQRRFDALVDICRRALAAPRPPGRSTWPGPTVHVFADAPTWAGLADSPVQLDGYGPVPAGIARQHFTDATWRAVVTDTVSGAVRGVSDRGYTPSARTRRHLLVQDRGCGFPGCLAAVWHCDADHNQPHGQGGCTDVDNCGLLCRRHHRLKTFTRWTWRRGPDGTLEWTDPRGFRWHREPISYRLPPPTPPPPPDTAPPPEPAPRDA